ncbi:hypothetical protein E3Q18_01616 [Wallemia mellicola]|uniref:Lysophospholipase n=1 Tax=Wallemia mellicola TaxID=1708541 RepID=A0A4T0QSX3_9BASI|nr:hypothetical protein E3Q19_01714 [Wallemia mellicola]TIB99407.1 hypothetical protein E3Q18_01616 [Wallemia mellicola]TIC27909.1 hypothetical protein E3Q10_03464 [Wallemia mellicola]TIC28122.1 hypothetical protein E3Q11_02025 [Wallemia mellicola]
MKCTAITALAIASIAHAFPSSPEELAARGVLQGAKFHALHSRDEGELSYEPYNTTCEIRNGFIRTGQELSSNETDYINARMDKIIDPLRNWLDGANLSYDIEQLTNNATNAPKLGLAVSGGGYRSMLGGAGFISALDNRNTSLDFETAGLLQSAAYMTGLSGGSWAVSGFAAQDMTPFWQLNDDVWKLDENIFWPGILDAYTYFKEIFEDVAAKKHVYPEDSFQTQITDFWGRALSYHLLAEPEEKFPGYGRNTTFSSAITGASTFQSHEMPYPIVLAVERQPNQLIIGQNASIWEMSPYEWGTFGPLGGGNAQDSPNGFIPIEWAGTSIVNDEVNTTDCVKGLDNFGFVIGSSATLFSAGVQQANASITGFDVFQRALRDILGDFSESMDDVALWKNPFYGWENDTNKIAQETNVVLVDGGLNDENLHPHLKKERQVDLVLAYDGSADTTYSWPNGTSLYATYNRTIHNDSGRSMANVPTPDQIVAQGLNTRPTFFGCNATDVTNYDEANKAPIIAYIPAYPYVYPANTSTFKLAYEAEESAGMIANGEAAMSLNGLVNDGEWKRCLACALVDRSRERNNIDRSPECQSCFNDWCWNGDQVDTADVPEYEPEINSVPQFVQDRSDGSALIQPYESGAVSGLYSATALLAVTSLVGAFLL